MRKILLISGTDTGVGKTCVTALLLSALCQAGYDVRAVKAIETGCRRETSGELFASDADFLSRAGGQFCETVLRFEPAVAPQVAAELAGHPIDLDALKKKLLGLTEGDGLLVIEGAGGILVPIARDYTYADLTAELGATILLVVGSRLGAINQAALTFEVVNGRRLSVLGYVLNRFSEAEDELVRKTNREPIKEAGRRNGISEIALIDRLNSADNISGIQAGARTRAIQRLTHAVIEYFRLSL